MDNHWTRLRGIADADIRPNVEDPRNMQQDEMNMARTRASTTVWDRVLCAIDEAPLSVQAARAAARLMPAAARLTLCTVVSPDQVDIFANQTRAQQGDDALARAQAHVQPFHDAEL